MPAPSRDATMLFALALEHLEGVGRVTAGRLLARFASLDDLRRYPREQVLVRIKGAPNAEALVARLFDDDAMLDAVTTAAAECEALAQRRVTLLTLRDDAWPARLADLPRGARPYRLFAYGDPAVLTRPSVAFFARPPLPTGPFEDAQTLVRGLLAEGLVPTTGAAHGFDVVVHRLAAGGEAPRPSMLVLPAGLARLAPPLRPAATAVAKAGGLLLSPFAMPHGPFDHDERERALVQAALADACVFVAPRPDAPEWSALEWAAGAGRPVFVLGEADGLPEGARLLAPPDLTPVRDAVRTSREP